MAMEEVKKLKKYLTKLMKKQKHTSSKAEWQDLDMEINRVADDMGAMQSGFWGG